MKRNYFEVGLLGSFGVRGNYRGLSFLLSLLLAVGFWPAQGQVGAGSLSGIVEDQTGAIVPGASGFAGQVTTWKCVFTLTGKGPAPGNAHLILVHQTGTLDQQGGTYLKATEKANIAYDPVQKVPAFVEEVRTHFPQRSVYNNDTIQLKLTQLSPRY